MTELNVSWLALWRAAVVVALAAAAFYLRDVFVVLAVSLIISSAFSPAVSFLERKRIPRLLGTLVVFLIFFGAFASVLYVVAPIVFVEFKSFLGHLSGLNLFKDSVPALKLDSLNRFFSERLNSFGGILASDSFSLFGTLAAIFGGILTVIVTVVFSFYLTVGRDGVESFLRAILPEDWEEYVLDLYTRSRKKIGRWFVAQLFLALVVGILATLGLWILGVKYPLVLGILAGLFEIVPVVGPIFAGTLAFLVGVSETWLLGLYVILFFFIIQQLENHVLVPLTMKQALGLHPLVILLALFIGSQLLGFIGLLLAAPAAVVITEALDDWSRIKEERRRKS